ncbi:hypothetical protein FRC12_001923 [Ceratobasidium sp. 428]|nr:hypothetical protein FRC12_001923 [Ceratobasidium sp. 428]
MIPEQLYTRLLHWLRISLSNPTPGLMEKIHGKHIESEIFWAFDACVRKSLQIDKQDPTSVTTSRLAGILLLSQSSDGDAFILMDPITRLGCLGKFYHDVYKNYGQLEDIDQAVECFTLAISGTPDVYAGRSELLNGLFHCFYTRLEATGDLSNLEHAAKCIASAPFPSVGADWPRSERLRDLGTLHLARFQYLGCLEDLETALSLFRQVASSVLEFEHQSQPEGLHNLGFALLLRHKQLGQPEDLDSAIDCFSQANQLASNQHVQKPGSMSGLGACYHARYRRFGQLADLELAIDLEKKALVLATDAGQDTVCKMRFAH